MNILLVYIWVQLAMISMAGWECLVEGRNAWDKGKSGPKFKIPFLPKITLYHFLVFWVMFPMLLALPLIAYGWSSSLALILASAYFFGMVVEDFFWYVFNPKVKFAELYSPFSDYYPWFRIGKKKIIPVFYFFGLLVAALLFYLSTKL